MIFHYGNDMAYTYLYFSVFIFLYAYVRIYVHQRKGTFDIAAIDGGISDRGAFFKEYSKKWYIRIFSEHNPPTVGALLVIGYVPALLLVPLACLTAPRMNSSKEFANYTVHRNHSNIIDIEYWSLKQGIDVYCAPGTETKQDFLYILNYYCLSLK